MRITSHNTGRATGQLLVPTQAAATAESREEEKSLGCHFALKRIR